MKRKQCPSSLFYISELLLDLIYNACSSLTRQSSICVPETVTLWIQMIGGNKNLEVF